MTHRFAIDADGAPVLLAAVEDPQPEPEAPKPDVTSQGSTARRRDAVIEAARTLEDLTPAGVEKLVRRRWRGDRAVTPQDVQSFATDARAQRVHDVVDALDFRIRRQVYGRAGSKQMHVSIPRGIISKSLASLDPKEVVDVVTRLRENGWTAQQIKRYGVRRVDRSGVISSALDGDNPKTEVEGDG
jgi:hypothetical protein